MSTPLEHPKDTDDQPFVLPMPSKGAPKTQPPRRMDIDPQDYKDNAPPGVDTLPKFPIGEPQYTGPIPQRRGMTKPGFI